ncbi:MAG: DUF1592 domain-containing protein, partial [Aureliella sp.]
KDFPADPSGGEGFDNTGEALGMSPNLVKKYLAAAQLVADHLVLKTDGISFAPFPVTSYNERKKLTEEAVIDFYERHAVDTLEYLEAAWRYRYRGSDRQELTIEAWLQQSDPKSDLSPRYLALVWQTLSDNAATTGYWKRLKDAWDAIPAPTNAQSEPAELLVLRDTIELGRRAFNAPEQELIKANAGNWPISHLDFRAKTAAARDKFDRSALKSERLLNLARVARPRRSDASAKTLSIFLRIDAAFTGAESGGESNDENSGDNYVIIHRPLFSKADRLPNNREDERQQEVQSLQSVLEASDPEQAQTLGFGKHPLGEAIDAESFVVKAPAIVEIRLTPELQLEGKHLLARCELDPKHSREGSVFIQHSLGDAAASELSGRAELLIHRESELAKRLEEPAAKFCKAFPNRFFYVDSGRGLAAGFHLVDGFFRDDRPLVEKVLSQQELAELEKLWRELDFVTQSAETLLRGFVWFERAEREVLHDKRFDFLRSEDPQLVEDSLLTKFEKLYLDKMGVQRVGDTLEAERPDAKYEMIHHFFQQIRRGLAEQQQLTDRAEALAWNHIEELARRAYRRPLSDHDRESLRGLYTKLRADGLDVEAGLRGVLIAILMSPDFCFQYREAEGNSAEDDRAEGNGVAPLSDYDLASRLSYFLWSSIPDEELLAAAEAGQLQSEEQLVAQTRRMLEDPRVDAFAREFFGQWLRYRDYLSKDPINAAAFPGYDEPLREAMFEEPIRLATYLIQSDRSILELLDSDTTFVNRRLAKHYGGELERQYQKLLERQGGPVKSHLAKTSVDPEAAWHPVSGLRQAGRGGLFGMAVILAKNSAGERTSPVKRGFWSVHHLLGQHFPPPPADIPDLPASEKGADRTIRELLAAHVANAQCAMCHKHFDGLGIALEGFDAIGRQRKVDSAGRPIDNRAELPGGKIAEGVPGLIDYIVEHRRQDFVRTLCRKFLGYALGRSVILSDQPLLDEMQSALEKNEYRFSVLFETVVRSPQFRNHRVFNRGGRGERGEE